MTIEMEGVLKTMQFKWGFLPLTAVVRRPGWVGGGEVGAMVF
jgi:hypothetical protein